MDRATAERFRDRLEKEGFQPGIDLSMRQVGASIQDPQYVVTVTPIGEAADEALKKAIGRPASPEDIRYEYQDGTYTFSKIPATVS